MTMEWYWPERVDLPGYKPTVKGHPKQIKDAAPDAAKKVDDATKNMEAAKNNLDNAKQSAQEAKNAEQRFLASYPFHPDLIEAFYTKWTQLEGFQRTRGVLRTFALALIN